MESFILRKKDLVALEETKFECHISDGVRSLIISERGPVVGIKIGNTVAVPYVDIVRHEVRYKEYKIVSSDHDTGKYDINNIDLNETYATNVIALHPNNYERIPSLELYSICDVEQKKIQDGVIVDNTYVLDYYEEKEKEQAKKRLKRLKWLVPFVSP